MKDWSSHSQQTGGYFQCNRFQAGSGADGGGTSEGPGEAVGDEEDEAEYALLFPEEAGNAHMEGLSKYKEYENVVWLHSVDFICEIVRDTSVVNFVFI